MRVLVTGAAGFLGSHVVDILRAQGLTVFGLDSRKGGDESIIEADLLQRDSLGSILREFDAVCHLAAVGDVYLAFENPPLAAAVNVVGTANLLDACRDAGIHKFVYASTWEVYGKPLYQPIDEDHPCCPDHPYNITKLAGEQLALSYDHLRDLPVISLRLGTAYGSRMRPNSVFSIFIRKARLGEPITIKGTGEQSRQFTHASDIGRAFYAALTSDIRAEVFNVVADEPVSIRQLAELVSTHIPTSVRFEPERPGDITPALISSSKARQYLRWEPRVRFDEGLLTIINGENV